MPNREARTDRFVDDGEGIEILNHPDPEIEKKIKENVENAKREKEQK